MDEAGQGLGTAGDRNCAGDVDVVLADFFLIPLEEYEAVARLNGSAGQHAGQIPGHGVLAEIGEDFTQISSSQAYNKSVPELIQFTKERILLAENFLASQ